MNDNIVFPSAFDPASESEFVKFDRMVGGALIVLVETVGGVASITISRDDVERLVEFLAPTPQAMSR